MMIIPAIDIKDGKVVRLLKGRFEDMTVYSDDPVRLDEFRPPSVDRASGSEGRSGGTGIERGPGGDLPLWEEYKEHNKSDIADVKNSGGRPAGSITAGWFLREFVEGFPWAHIDIAGTAYTEREDAAMAKGPTGIGVRLFSEFLLART